MIVRIVVRIHLAQNSKDSHTAVVYYGTSEKFTASTAVRKHN